MTADLGPLPEPITDDMIDCWRQNYGLDQRSPADAANWWQVHSGLGMAPPGAVAALGLLLQEREALRKDAARYRWLRDTNNNTDIRSNTEHLEPLQVPIIYIGHPAECWTPGNFASAPIGDAFDTAIDAAMAADAKEKQTR